MTRTADATAAPTTLTVKGQKIRLKPLRNRDYGEFERWVQDQVVDIAKRNIRDMDDERATVLLNAAINEASGITWGDPRAIKYASTIDGAAKLLWLSAKNEHPNMTEDDWLEWITDPDNMEIAMHRFELINYLRGEKENPTKPRRRQRSKRRRGKRKKK